MKKIVILTLMILTITCQKEKHEIKNESNNQDENIVVKNTTIQDNKDSIINEESKIEFEPIFFGLSPKMTDNQFNEIISQKPFISQKFLFPQDGELDVFRNIGGILFDLKKEKDRIVLFRDDNVHFPGLEIDSIRLSDWKNRFQKDIDDIINFYENKYHLKHQNEITFKNNDFRDILNTPYPERSTVLGRYGFIKTNYRIYQDSIKTVVLGLNNYSGFNFVKREDYLTKEEFGEHYTFREGYSIEINYFHNNDYDELVNLIMKDINQINIDKRRNDSIQKEDYKKNRLKILDGI